MSTISEIKRARAKLENAFLMMNYNTADVNNLVHLVVMTMLKKRHRIKLRLLLPIQDL